MKGWMYSIAAVATIAATATGLSLVAQQADLGSEAQRASGKVLYDKYCSQCHGLSGDGLGEAADYLKPRPRDFTRGKFKIRTTPTGALPTQDDLKRIIRDGMPYTSMPAWPQFSDSQLEALAYYIKTFYDGFSDPSQMEQPLQLPSPSSPSQDSIRRGRDIYVNLGCVRCHGEAGRGDGPAAREMTDEWGYHLSPADLTKPWTFRGGSEREVVYRTFMTGLNGTPMPSYNDEAMLPMEDRWPLVDYVFSLSDAPEPNYASLATAVPVDAGIDLAQGAEQFAAAPLARFPVIGQIMEPGRNFYPSIVDVEVRAIYTQQEIGILVEWNDIHAETTGTNDPSLVVPDWDPEGERQRIQLVKPQTQSDDPFADPFASAQQTPSDPFTSGGAETQSGIQAAEFSDAVAIQFPMALPTGSRKPYFLFGDGQNGVELWFVDLASGVPQLYNGRGSVSVNPSDTGEPFQVAASFKDGRWSVLFKRTRVSRRSISFEPGQFVPIAFSVWDGYNRERGNKRGLTSWFSLYLEPADKPSPVGPMLTNGLTILAVQILLIFAVRRKFARQALGQSG